MWTTGRHCCQSHNSMVVKETVCRQRAEGIPKTSLTPLIIVLMETGWRTWPHVDISRPEQRLADATVYHPSLSMLNRGTDNLSLTHRDWCELKTSIVCVRYSSGDWCCSQLCNTSLGINSAWSMALRCFQMMAVISVGGFISSLTFAYQLIRLPFNNQTSLLYFHIHHQCSC